MKASSWKAGCSAIDPAYFGIKGGRERWLYRVARKHAGGAGEEGFAITLPTLFEKSGAEGTYRRFKFEITKVARADNIPNFHLQLEDREQGDPILRMVRRDHVKAAGDVSANTSPVRRASQSKPKKQGADPSMPLFSRLVSDETLARIRKDFPGWDVYSLKAEFNSWIDAEPSRTPKDYNGAFYGFVRRHAARERA